MKIPTSKRLETPRCVLRYPRLNDAARMLSAFASDEFPDYVPLGQFASMERVTEWIKSARDNWKEGNGYTFTADRKTDNSIVGQVTLAPLEDVDTWALAFWTHPDCWGEGFATEIAKSAIDFAFGSLAGAKVWAAAAKWNAPSLRVLRKLGLKYQRDNPTGYQIGSKIIPTREFSIDSSSWRGF